MASAAPIVGDVADATSSEERASPREEALPARYSLDLLDRPPKGVAVAAAGPSCTWFDESEPSHAVDVDGHAIRLAWHEQALLVATEGKDKLWEVDLAHAGPIASTFCVRPGWHVMLAGNGRSGFNAFDLRTGKKLVRTGEFVVAPNDRWAITLPARSWGMSCFEASRAFRVPLADATKPYSLDTPPRPWRSLCDTDEAERDPSPSFSPAAAVSPASDFYAVVEEREIVLLRANDDVRVATVRRPRETAAGYVTSFGFSSDGRYLVLRTSGEVDVTEWYEISVSPCGATRLENRRRVSGATCV